MTSNGRPRLRPILLATLASTALLASACGASDDAGSPAAHDHGDEIIDIATSFYPAQFLAEQIGGELVHVVSVAPPGAEPHDLELTPSNVATIADADLVISLAGFQPAVDDALAESDAKAVLDLSDAANLVSAAHDDHSHDDDHDHDDHDHDDYDGHSHDDGHDHGDDAVDYHFWLDTERYEAAGAAVAKRLAELAPQHAEDFEANLAAFASKLDSLDESFATGLDRCERDTIVTSHAAFGYLAERYGLTQRGISGLSPEGEPSPAQLVDIVTFVADNDVSTIFFETLVSPAIAETIAEESGASTALLDPIESMTDGASGSDYFSVMTSNLAALRTGLTCQ